MHTVTWALLIAMCNKLSVQCSCHQQTSNYGATSISIWALCIFQAEHAHNDNNNNVRMYFMNGQ